MLTLRGTPFLYNGEEIGMTNLVLDDIRKFQDNVGVFIYKTAMDEFNLPPEQAVSMAASYTRDQCRSPMQWKNRPNAGFSPEGVETWLPVNPNFSTGINVDDQEKNPGSLLNFYRAMIQLRKQTPALIGGDYSLVSEDASDYLAFLRRSPSDRQNCLVILNFSEHTHTLNLDLKTSKVRCLYSSQFNKGTINQTASLDIEPFGIYIGELDNSV